jgi:hypothetical protein
VGNDEVHVEGRLAEAIEELPRDRLVTAAACLDTPALWRSAWERIVAQTSRTMKRLVPDRWLSPAELTAEFGELTSKLQATLEAKSKLSDSELRSEIVGLLKKAAKVSGDTAGWSRKVVDTGAHQLKFKKPGEIELNDLEWLITMKVTDDWRLRLAEAVARASDEQRRQLESRIADDLAHLSEPEREALRAALGDDLSGGLLLRVATTGGGAIMFAGGVQLAGFGAYLALTTVMHAVATTLFGVTLPFAAYTTATTALSLASGGLLAIPVLASWLLFYSSATTRARRAKVPTAITMILAADEARPAPKWMR